MDLNDAGTHVQQLTGRTTTRDALGWLHEGRAVPRPLDVPLLLNALAVISDDSPDEKAAELANRALKVVCRQEVRSALDPSTEVLALDTVMRPATYRAALDELASRTATKTLDTVTLAAVSAAQEHNPNVVAALCAVAGLSYRELRSRVTTSLPGTGSGPWKHGQLVAAFTVLDDIVSGNVHASSAAAQPMRPVEHLLSAAEGSAGAESSGRGWALVEQMRSHGVPFEMLLTQRAVGSAWGAHRNSTNGKVQEAVTEALCAQLDERHVPYARLRRNGVSRDLLTKVGANSDADEAGDDKAEGGQVTVLVHTSTGFAHAVAVSVARDGGTASKSGARLGKLPHRLGISCSVVLVGPGWSQRNETADLARSFQGHVYTEQTLTALAESLQQATTVSGQKQDGSGAPSDANGSPHPHHTEES